MEQYVLFILVYLIICNWIQLYYLVGNLVKPKSKLTTVDGKGLLSLIKQKTGLDVSIKVMSEKKKMIGFMVSSPPFKPVMIFSERLYSLLNKDEFEWVALHESGHYLMRHNLKFAFTQVIIGIIGLFLIRYSQPSLMVSFILSWLTVIIYIRIVRRFEFQADYFAVSHMNNPEGMISGNIKMVKNNKILMNRSLLGKLFIIAVSPEDRIRMAQKYLALGK